MPCHVKNLWPVWDQYFAKSDDDSSANDEVSEVVAWMFDRPPAVT